MKVVIDLSLEYAEEDNISAVLKDIVIEELKRAIGQMIRTDELIKMAMDQIKKETVPLILEQLRTAQARVIK